MHCRLPKIIYVLAARHGDQDPSRFTAQFLQGHHPANLQTAANPTRLREAPDLQAHTQ